MAHSIETNVRPLWHAPATTPGRMAIVPALRARRILLVTLLLTVTLATAAGLSSWFIGRPDVHFVSCWVTNFRDPTIAPNTAANQDRLAIQRGGYFAKTDVASIPVHSRFLMQQQLSAVAIDNSAPSIVLYVGTYATVDRLGNIVLLSSDFEPGRKESGLPLKAVLQSLAKSQASHKLLVLDIFALSHCPGLDAASPNVAAALTDELKAVPDTNRLVLCSCSPGQVALQSESLRRTLFGYYFEQAIRGTADGYNPDGIRDGRVTVREVARLLRARVDRWARHNHGKRQIPMLLGSADDFELAAYDVKNLTPRPRATVAPTKPSKHDKTAEAGKQPSKNGKIAGTDEGAEYPKWLLEGWKLRDQWQQDQVVRIAPRLFKILEASMLRIEQKWRYGGSTARLEQECQETLAHLKHLTSLCQQQLTGPDATSLAMVMASGHPSDGKALPAVSALVRAMNSAAANKPADRQATLQKQLGDFDKSTKGVADVDIALAVLHVAVDGDPLTPDRLKTLVSLLDHQHIADQWIELHALRRLAQRAAHQPAEQWSARRAVQLLHMTQQREQLYCRYETISWMRSIVDATAQACHAADVYYWNQRYVPSKLIDQALTEADTRCKSALASAAVLLDAHLVDQQAMQTLPWYATHINHNGPAVTDWMSAVEAARRLADTLESATDRSPQHLHAMAKAPTCDVAPTHAPVASNQQLDAIRQASSDVATSLRILQQPFLSPAIQHLIRRCSREDARPEILNEIDALLATPLLCATDRVTLWKARFIRAQHWHQQIAQWDDQEQIAGRRTPALAGYDPDSTMRAAMEFADLRQSVSVALLRLGSVTPQKPFTIPPTNDKDRLSAEQINALSRIWTVTLRKQIRETESLARRERLSWIFPPLKPLPLLDNPGTNPTVQLIAAQRKRLWSWLANWYGYETNDGPNSQYFAKMAAQYATFARGPLAPVLQTDNLERVQGAKPNRANATYVIPWTITRSPDKDAKVEIDVLNPATPWLTVAQENQLAGKKTSSPLRLSASLAPGVTFPAEPPLGFLVRWHIAGRTFHRKITVPALANQCYLSVLLSRNANAPESAIEQVLLRPNTPPQSYYLFVRNRGSETRKVLIRLSTGAATIKPLEIGAGESVRVNFPAPSAAPTSKGNNSTAGKLPTLVGPLVVTLLDATNRQELLSKPIPIQLLEPRQYVAVRDVRFWPSGDAQNRLEVSLQRVGGIPGPACQIGLDLSAAAIPGLLGLGNGLLKGTLPTDGKPLTLYVRNLKLADSYRAQGRFSISVDGVPNVFVFDTTFARRGDPTTPVEAIRPTLHLTAPRTGRSGDKFDLHIAVNYAPANAHINIQVGRQTGPGKFAWERTIPLPTTHERQFGFSPTGEGGALMFAASIANWNVPLNTAGLVGHRWLQVSLVSSDQRELAVARQEFALGNQPPQGVQFVDLPAKSWVGRPLRLTAIARQSVPNVNHVLFFLGKPINNAVPKGAVTATATVADADQQTWTAQLPLKNVKPGLIPVSAQFTNAAGLTSFATAVVNLTDVESQGGSIRGTVVEGTIAQHGLQVALMDGHEKEQGKTTTGVDGSFSFQNLKPGKYSVSTSKPTSGRHGSADVTVRNDSTTQTTIELWL